MERLETLVAISCIKYPLQNTYYLATVVCVAEQTAEELSSLIRIFISLVILFSPAAYLVTGTKRR